MVDFILGFIVSLAITGGWELIKNWVMLPGVGNIRRSCEFYHATFKERR